MFDVGDVRRKLADSRGCQNIDLLCTSNNPPESYQEFMQSPRSVALIKQWAGDVPQPPLGSGMRRIRSHESIPKVQEQKSQQRRSRLSSPGSSQEDRQSLSTCSSGEGGVESPQPVVSLKPVLRLEVLTGEFRGRSLRAQEDATLVKIGRDPNVNDLALTTGEISARHITVQFEEPQKSWMLDRCWEPQWNQPQRNVG